LHAREAVLEAAESGDIATLRAHLDAPHDRARASALRALGDANAIEAEDLALGATDPSFRVRRALAQLAAVNAGVDLARLLGDGDSTVVEVACWAAGERGPLGAPLLDALIGICVDHEDALCREAAVAALGAIGDGRALPTILEATKDRATVRRRAVLALAPFDGPEVQTTLEHALQDRDWQVRQAAEDLLSAQD
jgi:HEAT repeat protein